MLMSLFQVAGQLTPDQLAQLQKLGIQGGAPAAGGMFGAMAGAMLVFTVIIGIIGIVIGIMNLINIYHWGTAEKAAFDKAGETKKKWFINLLIIPMVSALIMIIPFIGWFLGAIGYIYSLVMILIYFFSIRKKIKNA